MSVHERLAALGIEVPALSKPVAAYVPAVISGNLCYASGQTPTVNGVLQFKGKLGRDVSLEEGCQAARLAALNCVAELQGAVGSLERVKRIVKVNGYVASAEGFGEQPKVVNGASELLEAVFGERGKHARAAVGVAELPFGAPVEIELIAEVE